MLHLFTEQCLISIENYKTKLQDFSIGKVLVL